MDVRPLSHADLESCVSLATEHGWQSDLAGWRMLLAMGEGIGAFDERGVLVATTTLVCSDDRRVAWYGMVLVARACARRGIGRRLVETMAERAGADAALLLYATEEGRHLYEAAGFGHRGTMLKHVGVRDPSAAPSPARELPGVERGHLPAVVALDARAFGAARARVIEAVLAGASATAIVTAPDAEVRAYGFARTSRSLAHLGPIAALTDDDAIAVIEALASKVPAGLPLRVDVHDDQHALAAWALAQGLKRSAVPFMHRGAAAPPRDAAVRYAIATPAAG